MVRNVGLASSSFSLYVQRSATRSPPICRATKCRSSSDDVSAHCRFSSTTSNGREAASRTRNCEKLQRSRAFASAPPSRGASPPAAKAGQMCASVPPSPRVSTANAPGVVARSTGRSASANTA